MRGSILAAALLCAACAHPKSEMYAEVGRAGAASKFPRGGIVRYLNEGSSFQREERRVDSHRKMFEFCRGKSEVVTEGPYRNLDAGTFAVAAGEYGMTGAGPDEDRYWAIVFVCR